MYLSLLLTIAILLLSSCTSLEQKQSPQANNNAPDTVCSQPSSLPQEANYLFEDQELGKLNIVRGQKFYVPLYSHLNRAGGLGTLDLAGILAIHNTSESDSIIITSVRYYDTSGKLLEDCLVDKSLRLGPMANTEFGVARSDRRGGSGANFIVEWVAEKEVSDPVVESIMITASGTQGFTFTSRGQVIEELK